MRKTLVALFLGLFLVFPLVSAVNLIGDLNKDFRVDYDDFIIFASLYGSTRGDGRYKPYADFDKDGDIDGFDLGIFADNYLTTFESKRQNYGYKLIGDFDHDCYVGSADAGILNQIHGSERGDEEYRGYVDLNKDGIIDSYDSLILLNNYGNTC